MALKQRASAIRSAYGALQALGRDPTSLEFDSITSPTRAVLDGKPVMLFGTNNYLGLTFDQHCIDAAVEAVRNFGAGTTGSRIANGTYSEHRALEAEIAEFYDKRATIL